jgi:uncharacterized protein YdaU (DUF1376 family)
MSEEQKRKAPAFQFYADDFLAGTSDMSAEEVGGYIRLLCHQWTKGGIPNDPDRAGRMATLLGSPSLGYVLAKFSLCNDGMLRNERLEQVRAEQEAYKLRQSSSGRNGAEKRWSKCQNDGNPNGVAIATPMATPMAKRWPQDSSPSPSPTPNKKDTAAPKSPWDVGFGVELPNSFQTENCLQAVKLWLQYKSERKEGYKKTGLTASLTKWSNEFSPAEFPSCVENSIASGWKGIFRKSSNQPSLPMQVGSKSVLSTNIADYQ